MKVWGIYNLETMVVEYTTSAPDGMTPAPDPGFGVVELPGDLNPQFPAAVYRVDLGRWHDPRVLQDHKNERWATIKRARDAAEFSSFTWDGSVFDSDRTSQSRIQGAAQLAQLALAGGQPFTITWTLADNSVRTLAALEMLAVGMAMGQHINECHERGRQRRQAIEAATSIEQVHAVVW